MHDSTPVSELPKKWRIAADFNRELHLENQDAEGAKMWQARNAVLRDCANQVEAALAQHKPARPSTSRFAPGDVVSEKGYPGSTYVVIHYNEHRDEIRCADDIDLHTLGGWNAYIVRRASYNDVMPPDDFKTAHRDGPFIRHDHNSYTED